MKSAFPFLFVFFSAACGSSSSPPTERDAEAGDAEVRDATCLKVDAPERFSTSEGNRVFFSREAFTTDEAAQFEGAGDAEVFELEDRLVLRAPYGRASGDDGVRVTCGDGSSRLIPLATTRISWTLLKSWFGADGPIAREYFAWWLDPVETERIWIYGGFVYEPAQFTPNQELWSFDVVDRTWTSHGVLPNAPNATGGRAAQGPLPQSIYYHGGIDATNDTPSLLRVLDYSGATPVWSEVDSQGTLAPGSYTGALIHDARRERWLSVCGASQSAGLNCRVTAFTEEVGWESLSVDAEAGRPRGRYGFAYAFDEENDRIVIFGGQDGGANEAIDGETWALELAGPSPRWVQLFDETEEITKRRNGAWALDAEGARLFVWGGTPDGANSVEGLQVLHLDRGHERWHSIATPNNVPPRTSGGGIYDAERGVIYWGFGNDDALYRDVWSMSVRTPSES